MLYVFSALHVEVEAFVKKRKLKRRSHTGRFQQFMDEDGQMLLTLTGVGEIAAAATVAAVLSREHVSSTDFVLSLGTAAMISEKRKTEEAALGEWAILNRLRSIQTNRDFYPDLFSITELREYSCLTGSKLIDTEEDRKALELSGFDLYDMEASAVYQAANLFLGPESMYFLRLLTDYGEASTVSAEDIRALSLQALPMLSSFIDLLLSRTVEEAIEVIGEEESSYLEKLSMDLKLSKTLRDRLIQKVKYLSLSQIDWKKCTDTWYEEERPPVRDKRAGQRILEELGGIGESI